jgi:hypothetical protein
MWLFVILTTVLGIFVSVLLDWFASLLASTNVPQDTISHLTRRSSSWLGRLRSWLTAKPKRLDYRRDKKGRFRRVRRG